MRTSGSAILMEAQLNLSKNRKQMNLEMHFDFGFENATCQYRFVSYHQLPEEANIKNEVQVDEYGSVEMHQIGQMQNDAKREITRGKLSIR